MKQGNHNIEDAIQEISLKPPFIYTMASHGCDNINEIFEAFLIFY